MDFKFTADHETLRDEIRRFAAANVAPSPGPLHLTSQIGWPEQRLFLKKLAARNWVAPAWPREYGGLGWGHLKQMIFNEEMSYAGAPDVGRVFSVGMIGPTLIVHGSDEQKRSHLPAITSGDAIWCQGYSEPEAGSDLASLQTAAVRAGDDYVVNGTKVWTTGAQFADWCFLLARTDPSAPKHRGLSFLLIDMKSPGITVQPIVNMANEPEFNQIHFDDVRVPRANLVGGENNGWYVGMTLLDFERSNVASIALNNRTLEFLAHSVRSKKPSRPLTDVLRNRFAELWIANETGRLLSYRTAWQQEMGQSCTYEASIIKVFSTELGQRITNFGVNLIGLKGALEPGSKFAEFGGLIEQAHVINVSPTIYSGSSEIQRNVIATRGLGLPRE